MRSYDYDIKQTHMEKSHGSSWKYGAYVEPHSLKRKHIEAHGFMDSKGHKQSHDMGCSSEQTSDQGSLRHQVSGQGFLKE